MVQRMRRGFHQERKRFHCVGFPLPAIDITFELSLGVLDGTVVRRCIWRTVNRDHPGIFKHFVNSRVVQIAAIVALAKQRGAEAIKQMRQMPSDFLTTGQMTRGDRRQLITRTKIRQVVKM